MLDRQPKNDTERRSQAQPNNARASYMARIPVRREDVLERSAFHAMLALERRRAERSRQPFILMLLDSSAVGAKQRLVGFGEKLVSAVSGTIRESDLIGWYRADVLGVIFTEINADEHCSVAGTLSTKVKKALREKLDPTQARKLIITTHVFPQSWNASRDWEADDKLYPDLNDGSTKRVLPMIIKRGIDVLGSAALIVLLAPVLAAIAVAIKLTSKGPVIFRQERLAQFGKSFSCLKFRTMYANSDPGVHREYVQNFISGKVQECGESAPVYKIKNDARVTPIGRFLRRTSLDEFPQFFNVLWGEMSLVGPRPPLAYEFEAYDFWHRRRVLEVKPGVTGLWQVLGRSRTNFDDMVRMDLRYCQGWSLWLDLKILLSTPLAVILGHGAY